MFPIASVEIKPAVNNGQVNFYISDGRDSGAVDASLNPPNIFTLVGADPGDLLGTSVSTGDVNGDGIRDVLMGAAGMGQDGFKSDHEYRIR